MIDKLTTEELEYAEFLADQEAEIALLEGALVLLREAFNTPSLEGLTLRELKGVIDAAQLAEKVAHGVKFKAMCDLGHCLKAMKERAK